jgi:hypothetical protein
MYHPPVRGPGLAVIVLLALGAAGCGSSSADRDGAPPSDVGSPGESDGGDAADGPACTYPTYTQAQYAAFVDGGTLGNLPCGGCAPTTDTCSPDGVNPGHGYACWAAPYTDMPPKPRAGCISSGVKVDGVDPTVWDVCCP